jgi:cytohesin
MPDDRNWTPLMFASDAGHEKVVRILLLSGANPFVKADRPQPADPTLDLLPDRIDTPVALVIRHGFSRIVQVFLDSGVDPNLEISAADGHYVSRGSIRLMDIAAMYDHGSVIEALVDRGAATVWDAPGTNGAAEHRDMVVYAAKHNCLSALRALIAKGAEIDSAYMYPTDLTPLIAAATEGFVGIISLLIGAGADLEKKDGNGRTALWHAAWNLHADALRMLIEHGAEREIESTMMSPRSVLINAATTTSFHDANAIPRIKLLIEHGFDVEAEDFWGRTPLIVAIDTEKPREDVVECLLAAGAKIVTHQGISALDAARRKGHENIVCLVERFASQGLTEEEQ